MNHLAKPARQAVKMNLAASLLRRATALTPDINQTVEALLAAWVEDQERCQYRQWAEASDAWVEQHGLAGAAFSPV